MNTAYALSAALLFVGCGGDDAVSDPSGIDGGYQPCANKGCGDSCRLCDPRDPNCVETGDVKYCDLQGKCQDMRPVCTRAFR